MLVKLVMGLFEDVSRMDEEDRQRRILFAKEQQARTMRKLANKVCDTCGRSIVGNHGGGCKHSSFWVGDCENDMLCKSCAIICDSCEKVYCRKHINKHKC